MKIHSFDTEKYKFREILKKILETDDLYHLEQNSNLIVREKDQNTYYHRKYYDSPFYKEFVDEYKKFIRNEIWKLYPDEKELIVQAQPTIRFQLNGNVSVGIQTNEDVNGKIGFHCDHDFGHPGEEMNFLVCLTKMFDSNSLFVETSPDSDVYNPIIMEYGEFAEFYGNKCHHYNIINRTGITRISFDFRVIKGTEYKEKQECISMSKGKKFIIGDYFDLYKRVES